MQKLPTNLSQQFLADHIEYYEIVMHNVAEFRKEFGDDIVIEVVESDEIIPQRVPLFEAAGYVLKDENAFGDADGVVGIACCYQKKTAGNN